MLPEHYETYRRLELNYWWCRARRRIFAAAIERFAPARRPLWIVDVGCGTSANLAEWNRFGRVVGLDSSPMALAYSAERGVRRLVGASLPSLPLLDASMDVVLALDVIEHVVDDRSAAQELWRVCKPGGLLVVSVPAYQWLWSEHDEVNEHKRRYTRHQLEACVLGPHADRIRSSYFNTLLAPAVMAERLVGRLCRRTAVSQSMVREPAAWLNRLLTSIFSSEWIWLRHFCFPFGISVLCIARKKT